MSAKSLLHLMLSFVVMLSVSSSLQGANDDGGDPPPAPPTLSELIAETQGFLDVAVDAGTIDGYGRGFWSVVHMWIMDYSLEQAAIAINSDTVDLEEAFNWLTYAYHGCNSARYPIPDLVVGEDVDELKQKILTVIARIAPLL